MYHIYSLKKDLNEKPERVLMTQKVTLDKKKPLLGLKGTYGLYGSEEWWNNIYNSIIPQKTIEGKIIKIYITGQDEQEFNTIDILLEDGRLFTEGMYFNNKKDRFLYKKDTNIKILYINDERKAINADGTHIKANLVCDVYIGV